MAKGNFEQNYSKVIEYLNKNDIQYEEFNSGQHLRILGPTSIVDLWPSRMIYHIVETEGVDPNRYCRLSAWDWKIKELEGIL